MQYVTNMHFLVKFLIGNSNEPAGRAKCSFSPLFGGMRLCEEEEEEEDNNGTMGCGCHGVDRDDGTGGANLRTASLTGCGNLRLHRASQREVRNMQKGQLHA